MAVGVIRAFIEKDYNKTIDAEYLKRNMKKELMEKVMERERFFFGALQRLDKPIQAIDKFIVNRQIEYGGQGNTWVMHWRTQEWLDLGVPRYNEYVKGGDEANDYLLDRTDSFLQFGNGQRVYILRTLNVDNRGEFDILKEIAVYGEWVLAFDHTRRLLPPDQYESKWRSIQIYDANEDEWAILTLEDLIVNSGRWDKEGKLRSLGEFGNTAGKSDSLHYRDPAGNLRPITRFGQMDKEHFPVDAIDHLAASVVRSVSRAGGQTGEMPFDEAAAVVREYRDRALNSVSWGSQELNTYLDRLRQQNNVTAPATQFNGVSSLQLTNGTLDVPANALPAGASVPPLLIHYAAMKAVADGRAPSTDAPFVARLGKALRSLGSFVSQMQTLGTLSQTFEKSLYSTYLPTDNSQMELVVQMIHGRSYLPSWLRAVARANLARQANPELSKVVEQIVGIAAQARESVETRFTGKFATVVSSGTAAGRTTLIAASLDAASAAAAAGKQLRQVSTALPAWAGNGPQIVVNAQNILDLAQTEDRAVFLLSVIHNLAMEDVGDPDVLSTEATKALILSLVGTIDPASANANATIDVIQQVVANAGINVPVDQLGQVTEGEMNALYSALTQIQGLSDRQRQLLAQVKRNYEQAKADFASVQRRAGANPAQAEQAPYATTATSGYRRTPIAFPPALWDQFARDAAGKPATDAPILMPADPANPAQIMPGSAISLYLASPPSILGTKETGVISGLFQAARERAMNGGDNQDRETEKEFERVEGNLTEVVQQIRDPLRLVAATQYLMMKPTLENVRRMIKQNIVIPFSFMIQRPAISWFTYGGLKVQAGEQTAVTWFKSPVWSWQDDGVLQVYRAVLTYYSKTTVLQPKNVYMARHLLLDEYLGGMGVEFYKGGRGGDRNTSLMSDKRNKHRPSILISVEPYEATPKKYDKLISVRGVYPTTYQYLSKNGGWHYYNADWVMAYYGLTSAAQMSAQDEESATSQPLSDAMMMWRGMARYPLPSNSGVLEYRAVSMPQGYFPDTIYGPGMRKTWDDPFTPYRQYDYSGNGYVGLAV